MSKYVKFIQEFLLRKKKSVIVEIVALTEECSALLQIKFSPKLKYLESVVISCTIGEETTPYAFCDLAASINLMPLKLVNKLKLRELKPTNMTLTLVDLSITYLYVIVEDVPVKVSGLVFPGDFEIGDMNEDTDASLNLCRPLLVTGKEMIDV